MNFKTNPNSDDMLNEVKNYAELHSMLNEIIDIVNLCYSHQVKIFPVHGFSLVKR